MKPTKAPFVPADAVATYGHLTAWIEEHEDFARRLTDASGRTAAWLLVETTGQLRGWMASRLLSKGQAPEDLTTESLPRDATCTALMNACEKYRREAEQYTQVVQRAEASSKGAEGRRKQAAREFDLGAFHTAAKALKARNPKLSNEAIAARLAPTFKRSTDRLRRLLPWLTKS